MRSCEVWVSLRQRFVCLQAEGDGERALHGEEVEIDDPDVETGATEGVNDGG